MASPSGFDLLRLGCLSGPRCPRYRGEALDEACFVLVPFVGSGASCSRSPYAASSIPGIYTRWRRTINPKHKQKKPRPPVIGASHGLEERVFSWRNARSLSRLSRSVQAKLLVVEPLVIERAAVRAARFFVGTGPEPEDLPAFLAAKRAQPLAVFSHAASRPYPPDSAPLARGGSAARG